MESMWDENQKKENQPKVNDIAIQACMAKIGPYTTKNVPDPAENELVYTYYHVPDQNWAQGTNLGNRFVTMDTTSWQDEIRLCIMSVTADTPEEQEERVKFLESLADDLRKVVESAPILFSAPDAEPPEREVKHTIRLTPDSAPIKRRPYPLPINKLEAMREQMNELIQHNWVEPSESPWGAPVLFVPKKNGQLRMCIDFRDLNSMTIDDSYPLPRLEILLHRASSATVFSKIDLASGFHQIEMSIESRIMTAFRLPEAVQGSSLWQWKVMPFGLRNAPPTFQRAMSRALVGCEHCAVVYIDDILIFSKEIDPNT